MDHHSSTEYYQARERHARGLAQAAVSPAVAKIHLEMAVRYADLVSDAAPVLIIEQKEMISA